jgi:predicted aldo/keto reductase-like oxidoreductase
MIYKPFKEWNLSLLGMGAMRLPTVGENGPIDEGKAREIVEYAFEHGVNYFDTAFRYHGGESESFLGKALEQFPREKWHIASKMPGHMMAYQNGRCEFTGLLSGRAGMTPREIFQQQLEKCRVDYFDFYLLHNLCETAWGFYTDEDLGVVEYLLNEKRAGRIRHLGFSAHGRAETIDRFLDWKDCFEFVQIQLNYLDWALQDARGKYEAVVKHGLPVIVMEPVRGGRLANLPEEAAARLKQVRPEDSIASWAFRFLQRLPGVQVVLSGMTTLDQLKDNLKTFDAPNPLTDDEMALIQDIARGMAELVPCTGCRYCCDDCPQGLDIPKLLSMYNEVRFDKASLLRFTLDAMGENELPSACLGCGACSHACPQGIDVPGAMKEFAAALSKIRS